MLTKTKADVGTYLSVTKTGWESHHENQERIYYETRCAGMGTGAPAKIRRKFGYDVQLVL